MRDDLLDAQAAIQWAVSDLPILARKIEAWQNGAPYAIRTDIVSQPGKKLFRLTKLKPIPAIINAETGIVIHSIRSSLDILAVALAERAGQSAPRDVHFPVAKSRTAFFQQNGAKEKIKKLAAADIATIERLEPWMGGNDALFQLHNLDITRKHRRLLSVFTAPNRIIVDPKAFAAGSVQFPSMWPGFVDDAVVAMADANSPATDEDFVLALELRLAEPGSVSTKPVIAALREFADLAQSVIKMFDRP